MAGIYTIFNKVEKSYSPLDIKISDVSAKRGFEQVLKSGKLLYPEDYELYKIGEINTDTFKITPCEKQLICVASDFSKEE